MLILKIIVGAVAAVSAAEGAERAFRAWMAWNSRRVESEANGLQFDAPPPSEW